MAPRQIYLPRFVRVIYALILREMATTYGKSYFGYLWAVLEPLGAIAVLSIAFSLAFRAPALGDNFPLFYATGYMPFAIYNIMQASINAALRQNKNLLFYPRVTYVDAIFSRFILNLVTQTLVCVIVFTGIIIIFDQRPHIQIQFLSNAVFAASILGLGFGALNSVLFHLLPAWKSLWGIITRPIFLLSCIFYLYDSLPIWAQSVLWYNPLVHVVGLIRTGIYASYDGDYVQILYPYCIGLGAFFVGLLLLRHHASDLIND